MQHHKIPHVGMRIIKSAFGVLLCFVIYLLRGRQGTPFYSALAVLWCIQNQTKNTFGNAIQRTIGTGIGAVYGLAYILFKMNVVSYGDGFGHYFIISLLIIPIIYTTVLFKQKKASYFSCVVFLSIVVNHLTDENPYLFVLNRSLDTLIGILLGLVINSVHIHGAPDKNTLFIANVDMAIMNKGEKLSPYSNVTINSMLESGINMTFSSLCTPASFLESMPDIKPKLPIISMDGAILYDIRENRYPKVYVISARHSGAIENFIMKRGFNVFTTVILEDVLLIYYRKLINDAEINIYEKLHKSPFRNYLNKERPYDHPVVYMMCIDKTDRIHNLVKEIKKEGLDREVKMLCYPSEDYKGYSYLKIYNKNASIENMIDYLKSRNEYENVEVYRDSMNENADSIVRKISRKYYYCHKDKKCNVLSLQA